jgi:hypothetical protein
MPTPHLQKKNKCLLAMNNTAELLLPDQSRFILSLENTSCPRSNPDSLLNIKKTQAKKPTGKQDEDRRSDQPMALPYFTIWIWTTTEPIKIVMSKFEQGPLKVRQSNGQTQLIQPPNWRFRNRILAIL